MKATITRATWAGLALALTIPACTSDDDTADTTTSTSETTDSTSTSTTEPESASAQAAEAWADAWTLAGEQSSTTDTLADLTTPEVAERFITTLHLGHDDEGVNFEGRTVTNHPVVEDNGDGTFTINDCLLITPSVTPAEANWYSGTVEEIDGQLVVTAVQPEVATGCVPATVADDVYAVFDRYWELQAEGVRPGNTEFEDMITGEFEDYILPELEDREKQGGVLREHDVQHPEVIEYRADFVRISSCTDASPETGAYDQETGERLGVDVPASHEGHNLYELHFALEDQEWRVVDRIGDNAVACEPAPTPLGIPEV